MGKWLYTVPEDLAERFRTAIEDDNYSEVIDAFVDVCTWIQANVPDAEYEMSDLLDEAELWDPEDEYFEDEMNYNISELYDVCDACRIWIPV